MKKLMVLVLGCGVLAGCGPSKKQMREILFMADEKLEQAKTADCDDIKAYLKKIQDAVKEALKQL